MSTNQTNCQNCEKPYEVGFKFCPHCGQKANEELTLRVLFYNTICNYFAFDARLFKSFMPLMFRPGFLAAQFVKGKRLLYLHPAQMYLFISLIFFFILSFSTRDLVSQAEEINKKVVDTEALKIQKDDFESKLDSVQIENLINPIKHNISQLDLKDKELKIADSVITAAQSQNANDQINWGFKKRETIDSLIAVSAEKDIIYREMGMSDDAGFLKRRFYAKMLSLSEGRGAGGVVQAFFDSIPVAMFFLLPLFAFIIKIFYFNKGKYVSHLIFSFYFFSFFFAVCSILFSINRFVYDIPDYIDWLVALSTYVYFLIALINFYKQNWFLTWIKSGAISFVFILFIIPTTAGLLFTYSLLVD